MSVTVTVRMYSAPDVARSARGNDAGQQQTTDGRTRSIRRSMWNMWVDETQADSLEYRLWAATFDGKADELRVLVELGADLNVKAAGGFTPWHVAAAHGH
eukprot:1185817-Prorocentrum_minimum.AAC.2